MYRILLFFLFLLAVQPAAAQDNLISVSTYGVVELPADIIQFNINMNAEADTPQKAYELHKEREKVLVRSLEAHEIQEKDIRFRPISIQKIRPNQYDDRQQQGEFYRTDQQVSLKLSNFEIYEQIQITLIENEFDSFNGNFQSSQQESGENEALRKAIGEAWSKAKIIADVSNIKLGQIKHITYNQQQVGPVSQMESRAMSISDQSGLMDFEQTIVVRASVSVDFYIAASSY